MLTNKNRKRKPDVNQDTTKEENKKNKSPPSPPTSIYDNFQQGDILFGLLEPRNSVGDQLEKAGFHHIYANNLNSPTMSLVLDPKSDEQKINELDKEQKKYYNFLQNHRDYLLREPGKPVPTMLENPRLGAAFRRGCKLLLVARDKSRDWRAHIITKNIRWKTVCHRNPENNNGVTNSEMRAAYRDYCANGPNPNIFFYDESCNLLEKPPWESSLFKRHWAHYDSQRKKNSDSDLESTTSEISEIKRPK